MAAARRWCETHPDHQAAFVQARALWHLSGQIHAQQPARRTRPVFWASAAALIVGIAVLLVRVNAWDADYRTDTGEQKRIVLADGSRVLLDSASAIDVSFSGQQRTVVLRKGEALFEVAHDPDKPFVVNADQTSATALGTVYAVSRGSDQVRVIVSQGRVAVRGPLNEVRLQANQQVIWQAPQLSAVQAVDTNSALAWRDGRLVFKLTPLPEVIAQIQRYRPGLVVIADDHLRSLKVSGTFYLDKLDEGLQSLEKAFPLTISRYTDHFLLVSARPANN
ncbi:FecR family protein [Pseudomonas tructae]|uniref:FecR family protein n=1 Tax=Pseudomonas tructae TaxID=2518644 RepID=UPI001E29216A|nr:FecR family protein [Pseudomonas tructae]